MGHPKRIVILGGGIIGMLAYKAVHETHEAAEGTAGEQQGNKEMASAAFNATASHSWPKAIPKLPRLASLKTRPSYFASAGKAMPLIAQNGVMAG